MGETSKKRGEFGEGLVENILNLIGWEEPIRNRDIECSKSIEHSISTRDRKDHGIDFIYHYLCPLITDTQNFVLTSSKYNGMYPSNPNSNFKNHIRDLAYAIECFNKSQLKSKLSNNRYGLKHKSYGVIFWLDNGSTYDDLIDRLNDFRLEGDLEFEAIYLVDNRRASFLKDTITFAKENFQDSIVEFIHPNTGYNSSVKTRITSSPILPVQYINTSILPLKIINNDIEYLILNSIEKIEEDYLRKTINLAHKLSEGWSNKIFLLFPDYNGDIHNEVVEDIKLELSDHRFAKKIKVNSYNPNFRNIGLLQ